MFRESDEKSYAKSYADFPNDDTLITSPSASPTGLAEVMVAWGKLSPEVREAILAIVRDATAPPAYTSLVAEMTSPASSRGAISIDDLLMSDN